MRQKRTKPGYCLPPGLFPSHPTSTGGVWHHSCSCLYQPDWQEQEMSMSWPWPHRHQLAAGTESQSLEALGAKVPDYLLTSTSPNILGSLIISLSLTISEKKQASMPHFQCCNRQVCFPIDERHLSQRPIPHLLENLDMQLHQRARHQSQKTSVFLGCCLSFPHTRIHPSVLPQTFFKVKNTTNTQL